MPMEQVTMLKQQLSTLFTGLNSVTDVTIAEQTIEALEILQDAYSEIPEGADEPTTQMFSDAQTLIDEIMGEVENLFTALSDLQDIVSNVESNIVSLESLSGQVGTNVEFEQMQEQPPVQENTY